MQAQYRLYAEQRVTAIMDKDQTAIAELLVLCSSPAITSSASVVVVSFSELSDWFFEFIASAQKEEH